MNNVSPDGSRDAVDVDRMMRHLAEFARWTKLAGSAEEAESLRYVEQHMASYGYATKIIHHPAYISLPGPARVEVDGAALRAITHSMSQSSPAAGLTAPVVYLGKGTEADFADKKLRGTIILVEGMATPPIALRASRAGAAGELHISPHEHLHEMCISPVWGSPDSRALGELPTTVAATIGLADGRALHERLMRGEAPRVTLYAEVDAGWRQTPILVSDADAPDGDDDTPFILFSGHHDTWYQGVMDNGAANVTMMEVARLMIGRRQQWRRSLRFCFWSGHSQGRYSSSSWYADTYWSELERRCAVHVNVDSTGGAGASEFHEAAAASELGALAHEVLLAETGQIFSGARLGRNADQSFWGVGIPSIFSVLSTHPVDGLGLRNNLGWWWHTPQDLIDKIDPALLERDTRVYRHLLTRLLTDEVIALDPAPQVADLLASLSDLKAGTAEYLPVEECIAEVAALKEACARISSWRAIARGKAARDLDQLLMRLSRALVPLDYTRGDRFSHDPALPQAKWPALDPLRKLAVESKDLDHRYPLAIEARRATNRLRSAVTTARRELALFERQRKF